MTPEEQGEPATKQPASMPATHRQLDPRNATELLRQAIERNQAQRPALATAPVRVGGQWLRRYDPGALAIDDTVAKT